MNSVYINDIITIFPDEIDQSISPGCYVTTNEKRKLDRYSLISLAASKKLYELNKESFINNEEISVIAANCYGAVNTLEDEVGKYNDNSMVSPIFITKILSNMQAAVISIALKLKGTNYTISTGVNSSCDAIIDGYELIKENRDKFVMIAGSDSYKNDYGKLIYSSYTKDDTENVNECGAAMLLGLKQGDKALAKITKVHRGVLQRDENMDSVLGSIRVQDNNLSHGIYVHSNGKLISDKPCFAGSQTLFDIKQGLEYCKLNKLSEFTVFSVSHNKFYCAVDLEYLKES